jgi:hypothetical protein
MLVFKLIITLPLEQARVSASGKTIFVVPFRGATPIKQLTMAACVRCCECVYSQGRASRGES